MTVYRGVVQGTNIVLTEPANLAEGTMVEVRVVEPGALAPAPDADEAAREAAFKQHLVRIGLLTGIAIPRPELLEEDDTPVELTPGPLLSELIIEERR